MSVKLILSIYFFSFFLALLDFSNVKLAERLKKGIFDFCCLILILVSMSKSAATSFDTNNYVNYFINDAGSITNFHFLWYGWEPGYVLLNSFVKTFTSNYHIFFGILTSIVLLLYRAIIFRYSKHIFLSLFTYVACFYFLNEIIILRFGLASAIVFFNVHNIVQGKLKKATLIVILATMFHYTALVALIPVLLYRRTVSKKWCTICIIWFVFFSMFFLIIPPISLIAQIAGVVNSNFADILQRLLRYQSIESEAGLKRVVLYLPFLILLVLNFFNFFVYVTKEQRDILFIQILYLLTSVFLMITCRQVASMARLNAIFLPINIVAGENTLHPTRQRDPLKEFYLFWVFILNTYIFFRSVFFNSGGHIEFL